MPCALADAEGALAGEGAAGVLVHLVDPDFGAEPIERSSEESEDPAMPTVRYNGRRVTARLEASR
jgi:hypothetical protein